MNALVKASIEQAFYSADWDPYTILGVRRRATIEQIRAAYRSRAKAVHSDAGGDAAAFLLLKEAHDFLLDTVARSLWDRKKVRATSDESRKARALLDQICGSVITNIANGSGLPPEHANLPDLMRKVVCSQLDDFADSQKKNQRKLGRLDLMKGKTRRKGKGDNIFTRIVDAQIAETKLILERLATEIRVGDIMLAELEAYECDAPTEPAGQVEQVGPVFTVRFFS